MEVHTAPTRATSLFSLLIGYSFGVLAGVVGLSGLTAFASFAHDERMCGGPYGFPAACGYALEPHHTAWVIAQTTNQYDLFIALAGAALVSVLAGIIRRRWLAALGFLAACVWAVALLNFFLNYTPADRDPSVYTAMGFMVASAVILLGGNFALLRRA